MQYNRHWIDEHVTETAIAIDSAVLISYRDFAFQSRPVLKFRLDCASSFHYLFDWTSLLCEHCINLNPADSCCEGVMAELRCFSWRCQQLAWYGNCQPSSLNTAGQRKAESVHPTSIHATSRACTATLVKWYVHRAEQASVLLHNVLTR